MTSPVHVEHTPSEGFAARIPARPLSTLARVHPAAWLLPSGQISLASLVAWVGAFALLQGTVQSRGLFRLPVDDPTWLGVGAAAIAFWIAIVSSRRPGSWWPSLWSAILALVCMGTLLALHLRWVSPLSPLAHALVSADVVAVLVLAPRLLYVRPDGRAVQWLATAWLAFVLFCGLPAFWFEETRLIDDQRARIDRAIAKLREQQRAIEQVVGPAWGGDRIEHEHDLQGIRFTPLLDDPVLWEGARVIGDAKLANLRTALEGVVSALKKATLEAATPVTCPSVLLDQPPPESPEGPHIWNSGNDSELVKAHPKLPQREALEDLYLRLIEARGKHVTEVARICKETTFSRQAPPEAADLRRLHTEACTQPSPSPPCELPASKGPRAIIPMRDMIGDFGPGDPIHAGLPWELMKVTRERVSEVGCVPAKGRTSKLMQYYCNLYAVTRPGAELTRAEVWVTYEPRTSLPMTYEQRTSLPNSAFILLHTNGPTREYSVRSVETRFQDVAQYQKERGEMLLAAPCNGVICLSAAGRKGIVVNVNKNCPTRPWGEPRLVCTGLSPGASASP